MKKLFTLCTAMLIAALATAQTDETFQFVDADGNVVSDGSTIVVSQLDEEGQMVVPLFVENISGEKAAVSLYETIDQLPNGTWQTCAFGNCMQLSESGYSPKTIVAEDFIGDIATEWIPQVGAYATWEAKLQIHVFNIITKSMFGVVTEAAGTEVIGYGPTVTVRFEYKNATTPQAEQLWWGYADSSDYRTALGTQKAETVNLAICVDANNAIVQGNKIKAVRFYLRDPKVLEDMKLWVSKELPSKADDADYVMPVDVSTLNGGDDGDYYYGTLNEVELAEPYAVSGTVYVGLTFTVLSVTGSGGQYPIVLAYTDPTEGSGLLNSPSTGKWVDISGEYGPLAMEILVEGTFLDNAVTTADFGEVVVAMGQTGHTSLSLTNVGKKAVKSVDYTITTGNETTAEQHLDLPSVLSKRGRAVYIDLTVPADPEAGISDKVLTITKVNGEPNEVKSDNTAQFTITTVSEIVDRKIVVEQYTGTTCGWCPRGHVGMAKMRKEFGDKFVGIAVHRFTQSTSQDAMYISAYNHVSFGGAPSCRINRGYIIDPYYGSGNDVLDDFREEMAIPAKVAVDVKGTWNEDSTKVEAIAMLRNVVPGGNYKIEYVLIADSLSGTTTPWRQYNYYNKAYGQFTDPKQLPDDLGFLVNTGEVFGNNVAYYPTFNDVAIAVAKSTQTTTPGELPFGEDVDNSYTLSLPTNSNLRKAIDKNNVYVVALVIDAASGLIVNADKSVVGTTNKGDVNLDGAVDVADISAVISIMADGSNDPKGDVNGDGAVDVADISSIISIMAGK